MVALGPTVCVLQSDKLQFVDSLGGEIQAAFDKLKFVGLKGHRASNERIGRL